MRVSYLTVAERVKNYNNSTVTVVVAMADGRWSVKFSLKILFLLLVCKCMIYRYAILRIMRLMSLLFIAKSPAKVQLRLNATKTKQLILWFPMNLRGLLTSSSPSRRV